MKRQVYDDLPAVRGHKFFGAATSLLGRECRLPNAPVSGHPVTIAADFNAICLIRPALNSGLISDFQRLVDLDALETHRACYPMP